MRISILAIFLFSSLCHGQNIIEAKTLSTKEIPSIESVRELIAVTTQEDLKTLISLRTKSIDKTIEENIYSRIGDAQQNLAAEKLNREYREQAKILLEEESKWENYESEIIKIYQNELTSDEINQMIPFFKTPLGKTILKKTPLINQKIVTQIYKIKFSHPSKFEQLTTEYKTSYKKMMPIRPLLPDSSVTKPSMRIQ